MREIPNWIGSPSAGRAYERPHLEAEGALGAVLPSHAPEDLSSAINKMAPVADLRPTPSRADNARERELYRYFKPPEPTSSTLSAHEASSPSTTLTALAQLCALRLHSKRAMIR